MATAADLLVEGERRLAQAGIEAPALDAELLLRHATGQDRAALVAASRDRVPPAAAARFRALVGERARRRPLQHLLGRQAFWRHEFEVTPEVLIPRPETELLVESALEILRGRPAPVVVDVGTGSGCIALSLAAERTDAQVHAVDLSPAALAVARRNAVRLGLEGSIHFHAGDLLLPLRHLWGRIDLVASNPPYVTAEEIVHLAPEVRDHEPREALVPPEGPPALYRRLSVQAQQALAVGGYLAVEVGRDQSEWVAAACEAAGLRVVDVRRDLQGIARTVIAQLH